MTLPAFPRHDAATSRLELLLALHKGVATLLSLMYNKHTAASVSGLLRKVFKVTMQLPRIKVKNVDVVATTFLHVKSLGPDTSSPVPPPAAASTRPVFSAATGLLGATLLCPTVSSPLAGPVQLFTVSIAAI
jgi:hypothetical protein